MGQPVAILIGLREMVAGIEKDHRHVADGFPHQVHDHHVFRLKAAGYADVFSNGGRDLLVHEGARGGDFFLKTHGLLLLSARGTMSMVGSCSGSKSNAAGSGAIGISGGESSWPSASVKTST